jgi:hypothetical protein
LNSAANSAARNDSSSAAQTRGRLTTSHIARASAVKPRPRGRAMGISTMSDSIVSMIPKDSPHPGIGEG